ncbi:uncharacterized protein LOC121774328 [Salvia splendens]|uniref:uncharacterized protein LOC121774328 n=1 Tax=Salvia splendens TaxID=180675 RepID=UPI001C26088E|nr:uncharacterized protein LOC121774328 [Salvia splendens]
MADREELERLQAMVKILMDEREVEKVAREAQEKKDKEIVPVMHMFNHRNMITFPEANNFELRMTLIQRAMTSPCTRHLLIQSPPPQVHQPRFHRGPSGFNVSKGEVVEPIKKDEKYDQGIMKILEVLVQERNTNDTKIRVVKARLNNLKQGIGKITTVVTNIQTQMDQVHKKLEEDKVKAAPRVVDISKKSVAKQKKDDDSVYEWPATEEVEAPPKKELVWRNGIVLTLQLKKKFKLEEQFKHFLNMFCKVHTYIPLAESLQKIPRYAKLLREAVMRKKNPTKADLKLPHHCSKIIQRERVVKQRDPDQFIIRCSIGEGKVDKALCNLGASINLMPLKYYEKLKIGPLKTLDVSIRLADNTAIKTVGMIEDVLVKVDDFIFPADFIILDMKVDKSVPLILGRDFLATCKALIDVGRGEITISDNYSHSTYKIENEMLKYEEAQHAKMERECRAVMMTDTSKPFRPLEGEDSSNPSIFVVHVVPQEKPKRKKKGKKKPQTQADPEVYVIKNPNGKYQWWKKICNKMVKTMTTRGNPKNAKNYGISLTMDDQKAMWKKVSARETASPTNFTDFG